MPDRTSYALTASQQENLVLLLQSACLDRESAKSVYEAGLRQVNPNVIGILIDKGLAEKRTRSLAPGGVRAASYWLTDEGAKLALQLLQDAQP